MITGAPQARHFTHWKSLYSKTKKKGIRRGRSKKPAGSEDLRALPEGGGRNVVSHYRSGAYRRVRPLKSWGNSEKGGGEIQKNLDHTGTILS